MARLDVLARVALHSGTGIPRDDVVNDWTFETITKAMSDAPTDLGVHLDVFYHSLGIYLSDALKKTAPAFDIAFYDITSHLDGSPHGSPGATYSSVGTVDAGTGIGLPNECACAISFHTINWLTALEHGPTATLPSTDSAQDQGAPATHTGKTRPKGRERGRIYIGPLTNQTLGSDAHGNKIFNGTFLAALRTAFNLVGTTVGVAGWSQTVWSRRNAAAHDYDGGWIDDRVDSQRRRQTAATTRLAL